MPKMFTAFALIMVFECAAALAQKGGPRRSGSIPTVGGYSNTVGSRANSVRTSGEFTTVGIVTQIHSESTSPAIEDGAFVVHGNQANAELLKVGTGIVLGDRIWVERGSLLRITDTFGGNLIVSGPATLEFSKRKATQTIAFLHAGSFRFKASEKASILFESILTAGSVSGEAAVWIDRKETQTLGLAGDVRVWHPRLTSAVVLVRPGYYTESSNSFKHLQPKKPEVVDQERFYSFMERFDLDEETKLPTPAPKETKRELASEKIRGSRLVAEVVEPANENVLKGLKAHYSGLDFEMPEKAPLHKK